jgi:hypothetical protein
MIAFRLPAGDHPGIGPSGKGGFEGKACAKPEIGVDLFQHEPLGDLLFVEDVAERLFHRAAGFQGDAAGSLQLDQDDSLSGVSVTADSF